MAGGVAPLAVVVPDLPLLTALNHYPFPSVVGHEPVPVEPPTAAVAASLFYCAPTALGFRTTLRVHIRPRSCLRPAIPVGCRVAMIGVCEVVLTPSEPADAFDGCTPFEIFESGHGLRARAAGGDFMTKPQPRRCARVSEYDHNFMMIPITNVDPRFRGK